MDPFSLSDGLFCEWECVSPYPCESHMVTFGLRVVVTCATISFWEARGVKCAAAWSEWHIPLQHTTANHSLTETVFHHGAASLMPFASANDAVEIVSFGGPWFGPYLALCWPCSRVTVDCDNWVSLLQQIYRGQGGRAADSDCFHTTLCLSC